MDKPITNLNMVYVKWIVSLISVITGLRVNATEAVSITVLR